MNKVGSTSAYCLSHDTATTDPAMATWDNLKVTLVDVEATALTVFGENRFNETFVDPDFKPGPEV